MEHQMEEQMKKINEQSEKHRKEMQEKLEEKQN